MAEHTPVPWSEPYQDDYPGDEGWWILNGKSGIDEYAVCVTFSLNPNQEADARFIWRACNAHDDLLAACEEVRDHLFGACGCGDQDRWAEHDAEVNMQLQAAIAKARR